MQPGFMALARPSAAASSAPATAAAEDGGSGGGGGAGGAGAAAAAAAAEAPPAAPSTAPAGMLQFRMAKRDKKGRMEFRGIAVPDTTKIGLRQATVRLLPGCLCCLPGCLAAWLPAWLAAWLPNSLTTDWPTN
jgi:hypothetical protein